MKAAIVGVLCVVVLVGCNQTTEVPLTSGIVLENMDTSVRPQDDFFRYVNGAWLETAEIPADRTNTGVFLDLRDKAREDVHAIIEEVSARDRPRGRQ